MELLLKIVVFVIFNFVVAEFQHDHHVSSSEKPSNLTDSEDRAARLKKYLVDCAVETNVDPSYVLQIRSGKWRQALRKAPPLLKKWSLCILVKSNMMSPGGVLRQDEVLAYIPEKDKAKVENIIDKCLYQKSHSPAEIAWHYVTCFRQKYSKYSII